jgi:NAD-dependent SIR2 family protein deacetylase
VDASDPAVAALRSFVERGDVVALTGAGLSTESGIPDYRGAGSRVRRPVQGSEFVRSVALRRRYWARAMAGWPRLATAAPNTGHRALAALEARGRVRAVITQNVDRLHHAAGSVNVHELHGALAEVGCLGCGALEGRDALQARLIELNPDFVFDAFELAPDGDAELAPESLDGFEVPACRVCGGVLKPRVVFFGENVAAGLVESAYAEVERARLLLVIGTSLAVYSGYRFLRRAAERAIPIAIVNRGPVRGEEHAALRLDAGTGEVLAALL